MVNFEGWKREKSSTYRREKKLTCPMAQSIMAFRAMPLGFDKEHTMGLDMLGDWAGGVKEIKKEIKDLSVFGLGKIVKVTLSECVFVGVVIDEDRGKRCVEVAAVIDGKDEVIEGEQRWVELEFCEAGIPSAQGKKKIVKTREWGQVEDLKEVVKAIDSDRLDKKYDVLLIRINRNLNKIYIKDKFNKDILAEVLEQIKEQ